MTTNDLAAIRARAEAATPGPWVTRSLTELYDGNYDGPPGSNLWLATEWQGAKGPNLGADEMLNHDAVFVAHARTDIPNLCDEVEALRGELARAREEVGILKPVVQMYASGFHGSRLATDALDMVKESALHSATEDADDRTT